jgi:Tol biopolymer transport system component
MAVEGPNPEIIRAQLERVLASTAFQNAGRASTLLRFLVERILSGQAEYLKEYTLGTEALGRSESFDPRTDPIARVEASRLRSRLEMYYATEGRTDPVRIVLPKGTYVLRFEHPSVVETDQTTGRFRDPAIFWKITAAAGLAIALVALWAPWRRPAAGPLPVTRLEVDLGPGAALRSTQVGSSSVIVSPDGRRLVFVSFRADSVPRLMTKLLDQTGGSELTELPGTEGARGPFFSPDGQWVAFAAAGKLKKIQVDGGTPITLCDAPDLFGGSWGDGDFIVAALPATGLWRVPSAGGKPTLIEGLPENTSARWPQVLPGSKAILFSMVGPAGTTQGVAVFSLVDRTLKTLFGWGAYGRYLASGHLALVDQGTVFVAPFDLDRLEITGARAAVLNDVSFSSLFGSAEFDVSRSGTLVYRRGSLGGKSIFRWLDQSGMGSPLLAEPATYSWPRLSPDGARLALSVGEGDQQDLRILDWRTGKSTQATFGGQIYSSPVWTPDGRFLVASKPGGGMVWLSADGARSPGTLFVAHDAQIPWSFDPSGRLAFYQRGRDATGSVTFDLWTVPVRTDGATLTAGRPEPFLVTDAFEMYPAFSPDGHWIAYTSLESGAYEVYVREFPDSGRKWQISSRGGSLAHWSRDGRRIYFRGNDNRIMVLECTARSGMFQTSQPRLWRDMPLADTGVFPNFDVAPDGRIAALMPVPQSGESQSERHVTFVLNFFDDVRRRAPR